VGGCRTLFLKPERYYRQRRNTVRSGAPKRFLPLDQVLWPEFSRPNLTKLCKPTTPSSGCDARESARRASVRMHRGAGYFRRRCPDRLTGQMLIRPQGGGYCCVEPMPRHNSSISPSGQPYEFAGRITRYGFGVDVLSTLPFRSAKQCQAQFLTARDLIVSV